MNEYQLTYLSPWNGPGPVLGAECSPEEKSWIPGYEFCRLYLKESLLLCLCVLVAECDHEAHSQGWKGHAVPAAHSPSGRGAMNPGPTALHSYFLSQTSLFLCRIIYSGFIEKTIPAPGSAIVQCIASPVPRGLWCPSESASGTFGSVLFISYRSSLIRGFSEWLTDCNPAMAVYQRKVCWSFSLWCWMSPAGLQHVLEPWRSRL